LFIVSDPTVRGLTTAESILQLSRELDAHGTRVSKSYFVLNRWGGGELPESFRERIHAAGLDLIGILPMDSQVNEADLLGRPLIELSEDSALYQAVKEILIKAGI
jgi:CO dehydrogenase maturation factor